MASVPPPPIQTPLAESSPAKVGRVWASWFRDIHKYLVSLVTDTITDHLNDTVGAHAASAISFSPTGTIAANDAQSAIAEVATDAAALVTSEASTRATADSSEATARAAADATLQTDINTRATSAALTAHTGNTSNPHATTADQVLPSQTSNSGKYLTTNGTTSNWGTVAAGGGGGVNFLGLNSSWTLTTQDDRDAESTVGNWLAYKNSVAGTSPDAGMTGGVPSTTLTRVTSGILNGAGSFKLDLGSGSSRQGEGGACVAYVPEGYRGANVAFTGIWEATGALVEDDLRLFAYDVTNSELVTPTSYSKIVGTKGTWVAIFPTKTTTAQLRVGVHVARTSTAALSVIFDDVSCGPAIPAIGLAGSDWADESSLFTINNFGTVASTKIFTRLVGDTLECVGVFQAGTGAAAVASISLPSKYLISSTKLTTSASVQIVGQATRIDTAVSHMALFYDGSDTAKLYISDNAAATNAITKRNGSNVTNVSSFWSIRFSVPISGRSSNVQLGQSSVYRMSSYLASGTRVTTTPTKLGEYRAMIHTVSTTDTHTDDASAPTPSATDGVRIFAKAYNSAGSAGSPNRYEIFVGKNKHVRLDMFAAAGKTTPLNWNYFSTGSGGEDDGTIFHYDPSTGVATVDAGFNFGSSITTRNIGYYSAPGGGLNFASNGYFDIVVSENPLFVSSQAVRSEVHVTTGNGHGSTNTKIRRYSTTLTNIGSAITYTDDAANGASFTLNEDGVYSIAITDRTTGAAFSTGFSAGSNQLTTSIVTITNANRVAMVDGASSQVTGISRTKFFPAGTVIRPHDDGTPATTSAEQSSFSIVKVSN